MEPGEESKIDSSVDGFESLVKICVAIDRREMLLNESLVTQVVGLCDELARGRRNLERLLGLLRATFASNCAHRRYLLARALVLAIADQEFSREDLRILVKSQFERYFQLWSKFQGRLPDSVTSEQALATVRKLARANPQRLPAVLQEVFARSCYDVESQACLIAYREKRDVGLESFLLSKAYEFLTRDNLFSKQGSAAQDILQELVAHSKNRELLREQFGELLRQLKPSSSERQTV